MRYVDAHVHLSDSQYETCLDKIIGEARRTNTVALVSNSTNLQTSIRNVELAGKYQGTVYAALGVHPWNVEGLLQNELEQTVNLITSHSRQEGVVAIGEIGLDYKYAKGERREPMSRQYEVFCRMLQLSEKLALPAVIHSRGATQEIVDTLSSYNIRKVMLHWFSNPIELLPKIVERGYYITEGPAVVFSSQIREIVRQIPLTNLLTETDGPVRIFKPLFEGKMATPSDIPLLVETMAGIKGKERTAVAEQIHQNFLWFFAQQ